jgi:tRNA(adenine34) deaminase
MGSEGATLSQSSLPVNARRGLARRTNIEWNTRMGDALAGMHETYMRRCIELAARAVDTGDVPVGALIVQNGEVIAEGIEAVRAHGDVTAHAEIEAVRRACARLTSLDLSGCTLYTSVEPCPMCAYAIRLARVGTVVSGARTPESEERWSGWSVLTNLESVPRRPPPSVVRDVLAAECLAALERPGGRR